MLAVSKLNNIKILISEALIDAGISQDEFVLINNVLKEYDKKRSKNPEVVTTKNDLDKVCFQHDMIYEEFEDLTRRTASDKILCDEAFNIAKTSKYDGYQLGLASMVYKHFF